MNNQENIIKTIETATGLSGLGFNRAILAYANFLGLDATKGFNSALMQILKANTPSTQPDLNGLLAAYSAVNFDGNVNSINDLTF